MLLIISGVGITNLIVNATIFDKPRDFIQENSNFFGTLVTCMMCSGTWVGFILALLFATSWQEAIFLIAGVSLFSTIYDYLTTFLSIVGNYFVSKTEELDE